MPNQDPHIAQELLSHQTFLRRLAVDLVGEDADDLVQDVWQRALERPPQHARQLRGWLARVARNLATSRWRGEARRTEREERRASEQAAADELEARLELRKELVGALDSLSQSCRETILLRYFEGLAPRDIAKRHGIPVATVKTHLRRGLAQLRDALDKRYGGDRATWMPAVTALGAPGNGLGTGSLVIGGMAMGTMTKVSAVALIAAACVYFATRTPRTETAPITALEPPVVDEELRETADGRAVESPVEVARRNPVAEESLAGTATAAESNVLRVILEGITEEEAQAATVTLTGVEQDEEWPDEVQHAWTSPGLTSEFDLDPLFARRPQQLGNLRKGELQVEIDHPHHLPETARIPLSSGVERKNGQTVYEARVHLADVVFWPELTLAVRDAQTRAHLEDVEVSCISTAFMLIGSQPGAQGYYTSIGEGLSSPIVLLGGRAADGPENRAACIALRPEVGVVPLPLEIDAPAETDRGLIVFARAPGYAWSQLVLDVSTGGERELLLGPAATLDLRFANLQLERYPATATLGVVGRDSGLVGVWRLDEELETEGLRLEGLAPDEYTVSVGLGGPFSARNTEPLAQEKISLAARETREFVLALSDPPAPRERTTLAGVVSFPTFGGEEEVRLQLYMDDWRRDEPDFEFSLADMQPLGGALPTWSFEVEDIPVGVCQMHLVPFQKGWMIEVPSGGRADVELVIPELAEVVVETVDWRSGERIPLEELRYGYREDLPGRVHQEWSDQITTGFEGEPGRFRFWTAPGEAFVMTWGIPEELDYGVRSKTLALVPGLQSAPFELTPFCAIHIDFRDGAAALPREDRLYNSVSISPVDHEGRAGILKYDTHQVDPGLYEISFQDIDDDRFHLIQPRRIDVREGETVEVTVQLQRK